MSDPTFPPSEPLAAGLALTAKALARVSLERLAGAIQKDDSVVSRIRSGQTNVSMEDAVRMLYAAGLKVVPANRASVDPKIFDAISAIALKAMADERIARQLLGEE